MGTYPGGWAKGISYPAAQFLKPYPCPDTGRGYNSYNVSDGTARAAGKRWCGVEGQIKDMKALGANPSTGQLQPGIWMDQCFPNGCDDGAFSICRTVRLANPKSTISEQ